MEDKLETSERVLQVTSDSSIDGYIRALQAGCRCVEVRRLWEKGRGLTRKSTTKTLKTLISDLQMRDFDPLQMHLFVFYSTKSTISAFISEALL